MNTILVLLALICTVLVSCHQVPVLEADPRPLSIADRIERSSLVVIGTIEAEKPIRDVEHEGAVVMKLMEVRARLEGVLKGNYQDRILTFYYFAYAARAGGTGPAPNFVATGDRRIIFLRAERGVLRATNDVYSSMTSFETGKHTLQSQSDNMSVRRSVARLLLLPGREVDIPEYLASLSVSRAAVVSLVGQEETRTMLSSLLQSPDPRIRREACLLLAASEPACSLER